MERNVGPGDRVVRVVIAIALAVLLFVEVIEGVGGIVAGLVAAYLLVTALLRSCLFYKLAGVDSTAEEQPYSTTDDRSGL